VDKDRNKNPGKKIILCLVGYALVFSIKYFSLRDRPFNLKGGVRIFFFCRAKRKIFIQNITLGYMTKTLNQIIFFFLHQNQNIFFSNIGNQNIFLEKNHNPPDFYFCPCPLCIYDLYIQSQYPVLVFNAWTV
jgi:hypothetical protein